MAQTRWHTILPDEGHDYLRGQHNARPGEMSPTLKNWRLLQYQTNSIFVISGTPFVTKVSYGFAAITKSVAKEQLTRATWGPEFTDAGLSELTEHWKTEYDPRDAKVVKEQEMIRCKAKDIPATSS
jgi:hypothetical protein